MIDLTSEQRFSNWKLLFPEADQELLVEFSPETHDKATDFNNMGRWYFVGTLETGDRINQCSAWAMYFSRTNTNPSSGSTFH